MSKKQEKKFNYAVAHYWDGDAGSVGVYYYFGGVHHGTMKDAEKFLEYVKSKDALEKKKDRKDWKIFQLIEVPV